MEAITSIIPGAVGALFASRTKHAAASWPFNRLRREFEVFETCVHGYIISSREGADKAAEKQGNFKLARKQIGSTRQQSQSSPLSLLPKQQRDRICPSRLPEAAGKNKERKRKESQCNRLHRLLGNCEEVPLENKVRPIKYVTTPDRKFLQKSCTQEL